jgi:hypothetical protein
MLLHLSSDLPRISRTVISVLIYYRKRVCRKSEHYKITTQGRRKRGGGGGGGGRNNFLTLEVAFIKVVDKIKVTDWANYVVPCQEKVGFSRAL